MAVISTRRRAPWSLPERLLLQEEMDRPDLDPRLHDRALRGLEHINTWSLSARIPWLHIQRLAQERVPRPIRVLDIASGGGDTAIALWKKARQAGLAIRVAGCDMSPHAIEYASRRAEAEGAAVQFFRLNVLEDALPSGYDVIISSLFLHHLTDTAASRLLAQAAAATRNLVCINDLVRCRRGLALAHLASHVLTTSRMVWADAPQSVRAAFTLGEVRGLAGRAGLQELRLRRCWPCRFVFLWSRS